MISMTTQGEVFEPAKLWPPASAESIEFSNRLSLAICKLPPGIGTYAGQLSGLVEIKPGHARRGSQEPKPYLGSQLNVSNDWEDLAKYIQLAQPALQSVRDLMQDPPSGVDYDIVQRLKADSLPNYVAVRRAAQALHAAVIQDLHSGDLDAAEKNLRALSAFVELREGDPSLIWFMIRVAVLGLGVDAYWDAVQADGWTESQLAALQEACQCDKLLSQMPRTMAAERVVRLNQLRWFRSHSYEDWVDRYGEIYQSFGSSVPSTGSNVAVRLWREKIFHPTWSFAWADEEQLNFVCHAQEDLEILRKGAEQGSWIALKQQIDSRHSKYRPPVASWRFYTQLPLVDTPHPAPYPYPNFSRAWFVTMKNLTLNQMASTAIALKRYQLLHGQLPAALASLVPEFLPACPRDYMNGQDLRYRSNGDGSFTLYSVAEDGVDDGGDPSSADSSNSKQPTRPWMGRDWVWPHLPQAPEITSVWE
jgi:hypothetical protein